MTNLSSFVPDLILQHTAKHERDYLQEVFCRFNGYPGLEEIWQLMDEQWIALRCDPQCMDERVATFYRHPVWMLNGLFIEQHADSLENRQVFTDWVVRQRPARIADFGGGFGGLARFIGTAMPSAQIEIVEPHPHPAAIALAKSTPNVRFVPELSGKYDILIATDVFEHVPDPIELAAVTATHLHLGGQYLIANSFAPVILCHLPQLFHFQIAWDAAMRAMGLRPEEKVSYGRVYRRSTGFDIAAARRIEKNANRLWPLLHHLPRGRKKVGVALLTLICW
ncbi:MAG: class I SAM-dependent methyltransferase [Halioglobus sp.]|nr:class I SAM-dependent methyltransferase [Halioglobus sp.]